MTYEEYNNFCAALPATTHVVQWGNAHVWKVGGKVFAIGGWAKDDREADGAKNGSEKALTGESSGHPAFTFKTSELNYALLKDEPGYRPAPYLASRGMKWIQLYDAKQVENSDDALQYYLSESYRIVSLGLTKKLQKELGLNQNQSSSKPKRG